MTVMRVDISNIAKINGASLEIEFFETLDNMELTDKAYIFDKPVTFKGFIVNVKGTFLLKGSLKVEYRTKCYRCLKAITGRMETPIRERFSKNLKETDDEIYPYKGNEIDITKALTDNIILNLPMKQVCMEDCKGLCASCGIDLNKEQCGCKEDNISPHFEDLKNYFKN